MGAKATAMKNKISEDANARAESIGLNDKAALDKMWKELDFNGNGLVSLAEIDKWVVYKARRPNPKAWKGLDNKPALIRAYKRTTSVGGGGDGDDWVEKKEFKKLLVNIFWFNFLWNIFDGMDGDDRRIDIKEFRKGMKKLGLDLTKEETVQAFSKMDKNGGGQVLFDEFCLYVRREIGKGSTESGMRNNNRGAAPPSEKERRKLEQSQLSNFRSRARSAFNEFDPSGTGFIERESLGGLLRKLGMPAGKLEVVAALRALDTNGDGVVSYEEFEIWYRAEKFGERPRGGTCTRGKTAGGTRQRVSATTTRAERRERVVPGGSHTFGKATSRGSGVDGVFGTSSHLEQGFGSSDRPFMKQSSIFHSADTAGSLLGGQRQTLSARTDTRRSSPSQPNDGRGSSLKSRTPREASNGRTSCRRSTQPTSMPLSTRETMVQARRSRGMPGQNTAASNEPDAGLQSIILRLRRELKKRGGSGIMAIARKFRIIDDDGSGALSLAEFKKAMEETNINGLQGRDLQRLFQYFDRDGNGEIDYDEFLRGVVGPMSDERLRWVNKAFKILDEDGSGVIDIDDIRDRYNAKKHPEVVRGAKTEDEALQEILSVFEVGGVADGKVTPQEFENYYTGISAGIENDDYFELMMRNAWHISGGEGAKANSSNLRVLVVHTDGKSEVVCIKNDLGLDKKDSKAIIARLKKQGVRNIKKVQLN